MESLNSTKTVSWPVTENGCEKVASFLPAKKILVISNLYPPQELGGYGRLIFDFANILHSRGHCVHVLTSDASYLGALPQEEPFVDRGLLLYGTWQDGTVKHLENEEEIVDILKKNDATVKRVINEFSPDLCLLGNIDCLSHLVFQPLLKSDIPIIHHLGNEHPGYAVNCSPASGSYVPAAASGWLKNKVLGHGYNFKDFPVIYPGAMVKEFETQVLPDVDKLRIAYASIIQAYKGPQILVSALKILHDQGFEFTCSIAGTATDQCFVEILKKYVQESGMQEKVSFVGFLQRQELKNFFARHNILAFPSVFQEPFGISQVEAMAAGLTVVTSGTGGAKEIVEHGKSGLIFKSEDHESLAQELLSLAQDKNRWQQITGAGQKRAMKHFDIQKSVDDLEKIFHRLLNKAETCMANI